MFLSFFTSEVQVDDMAFNNIGKIKKNRYMEKKNRIYGKEWRGQFNGGHIGHTGRTSGNVWRISGNTDTNFKRKIEKESH